MTARPRITPQAGPQTRFSATTADIALYGGSAGGGKSFALCFEAARFANRPGYAAVIFRRTSPELQGGGSIFAESRRIYPSLRGVARESPNLDWSFPSGAVVEFRHLQHEHSVFAHQSKQYAFVGFDELTHFLPSQFWYMLSRLRGVADVPKRLRATCNPDPDSFVRALVDWYIGDDGIARDDRSGIVRWFVRLDDQLVWGDSPEEVHAHDPGRILARGARREIGDARPEPMSFTFVRARVDDNRILLAADPGYVARLGMMVGAQLRRLRDGDWDARDRCGDYFDRLWCSVVAAPPPPHEVVRRIRYWDKAATTPSAKSPDPDYTRGIRIALTNTGRYVVEDLVSLRAGPADVDALMRHTAEVDGIACEIGAWQDPGQAGIVDVEHMRTLLRGFSFDAIKASQDKRVYARVWSPLAKAGKIDFVRRGDYLPELFAELEGFPLRAHDDIVDAMSGAMLTLVGGAVTYAYDAAPDHRHAPALRDAWDEAEDGDDDRASTARGRAGACF